jgi:hypothetical protein
MCGPARLLKISTGGYLSMNATAWLPRQSAVEGDAALKREDKRGHCSNDWA